MIRALYSAASGMNAMAHAIEAIYAAGAGPVAVAAAEEAIRTLARALPAIVDRPGDPEARALALRGAHASGMALELMDKLLEAEGIPTAGHRYLKIFTPQESNNLRKKINTLGEATFLSMVFNFVDMLAHGRSESELLQELAPDEEALRGVLQSWFQHSALLEVLRVLSRQDTVVVVTTDHGLVQVKRSSEVLGNRDTSTSIRYKYGDNLGVNEREALHIKKPEEYKLPGDGLIKHYIVAKENFYFVYPTNFHQYERHFRNSFQHGAISMEEMILPVATLYPRSR